MFDVVISLFLYRIPRNRNSGKRLKRIHTKPCCLPLKTKPFPFEPDLKIHYKKERRPRALKRRRKGRAAKTEKGLRERQQETEGRQAGKKQGGRKERTHRKGEQGEKRNLPGQGSSEQD
jgi:hypothetical protein